ncbi:Dimerisation domain-containing protein [Micromonospora nigra]|uniref:Dimerisation domain-containing protein n=1 Tax=Micromonospora nigra TaxID=145857 RepID=A0A1C6SY67_9ACTN|nr:methyltransferase [Micromonospora nigra]SCL34430.1 Dimerisation domain-containing protein [Micromonospora nigra]
MADKTARPVGLRALADLATPMAVRVAATLRVADHLAAGRCTAVEMAQAADAHPDALDRLLRHLVTIGLLTRDGDGRYATTEVGEQLRDDHPGGRRKWLDISGGVGRGDLSFVDLIHAVRTGAPAYPLRYGTSFWEDLGADGQLSASFDALMGHHIEIDDDGIADAYDWAALGHVADVGGGSGALLGVLLSAHPGLRGTLVDLPGPSSGARRHLRERGLADRAEVVTGSFFDPLPPGAGGYILSAIIHDWDDEPAVAILRRCAEAAGDTGRVLVVEAIGADGDSPNTAMDLRMLVYTGGRERGLPELRALAAKAGLVVRGVHPVGARPVVSIVELVTR